MGRWCTRPGRPATRWCTRPGAAATRCGRGRRPHRRSPVGGGAGARGWPRSASSRSCAWRCSPEDCCSRCWPAAAGSPPSPGPDVPPDRRGARVHRPPARPTGPPEVVGLSLLSRGAPRPLDRPSPGVPDERTTPDRCPRGGPAAARRLRERHGGLGSARALEDRAQQRGRHVRDRHAAPPRPGAVDGGPHPRPEARPRGRRPRRADPRHPGAGDRDDGRLAQRVG